MKDIQLSILAIMFIFGILGMWAHFRQQKRRGIESGTFWNYLFADSPGSTGITLGSFAGAMGGLYGIGTFDQVYWDPFVAALKNGVLYAPMAGAAATSFMTGFSFDSMMNKGTSK